VLFCFIQLFLCLFLVRFHFILLPFAFCLLRHFFNFLQQKKKSGEDGTLRIWHSTTHRLENTLNYGMNSV
jgi:hypothetical protein